MSAFVIHQSRSKGATGPGPLDIAASSIRTRQRLPETGRLVGGTSAVAFDRRPGGGATPANSRNGWLVTAGTWFAGRFEDNPTLLEHLERDGPAILAELDGSFALAWWDGRQDVLHVALDWPGRRHLYAAETEDGLLLATSSVALATALHAGADAEGVGEFLATGTLRENRTIFRGIRRLAGGTHFRFVDGAEAGRGRLHGFIEPPGRDVLADHGLVAPHDRPAEGVGAAEELGVLAAALYLLPTVLLGLPFLAPHLVLGGSTGWPAYGESRTVLCGSDAWETLIGLAILNGGAGAIASEMLAESPILTKTSQALLGTAVDHFLLIATMIAWTLAYVKATRAER